MELGLMMRGNSNRLATVLDRIEWVQSVRYVSNFFFHGWNFQHV